MKRAQLLAVLLVPLMSACRSEEGTVLQIRDSPSFEDDCSLNATPTTFQAQGFYDPSGGGSYLLTVYIINNTINELTVEGAPSANDAQLIGLDYCLYDPEAEGVTAYDPKGKGDLLDCDDVPDSQRAFVQAGGTVTSGGGTLVSAIGTIDLATLRGLFGETFRPTAIPVGDDPTNTATRSAAWGNFPASFSTVVTVQVRIRAKDQSGRTVRSNWYAFPVTVAPTSVRDACTASILPCPGGGTALQGSQFAEGTCGAAFSGADFTCEDVNLCP